jgi:hypothetical protein
MKKEKNSKYLAYTTGQVIRYKNGSVSIVSNVRPIYYDVFYNTDVIDLVIDKSIHPVWSLVKKTSVKALNGGME